MAGHTGNSLLSDMKGIFVSHGMRGMLGARARPKVTAGLAVSPAPPRGQRRLATHSPGYRDHPLGA